MELTAIQIKEELEKIQNTQVFKAVISNPMDKDNVYIRILVEKNKKGNQEEFIISSYTEKQVFHTHISLQELASYIYEQLSLYKQLNVFTIEADYMIKTSKKGKIFFSKTFKKEIKEITYKVKNNRKKQYILEEGTIIEPLIDMGIFTKEGKVVTSMYDKFKQINRFIEIIDDTVSKMNMKSIHIIDFGCGKSYLTFVMYYYFKFIKEIEVEIIGLDLKEQVIENCNIAAKKYGYDGLRFQLGDINGFKTDQSIDMVITLHACDMATDYALYNAIKWNAKMIFSVPCCQHELNKQIETENLSILTRYGIAKERLSSIYTDVIRCNLLEAMSYKVQLMEFVDFDNTPKNLLIRANLSNIPDHVKASMIKEVEELSRQFHLKQKLHTLLKDDGFLG